MSQKVWTGLALGLLMASAPNAMAAAWDAANAPNRLLLMPGQFYNRFDEKGTTVPFEARLPREKMPYADTYWPSNRGGIAYRWNANPWVDPQMVDIAVHYNVRLPTITEQRNMDEGALEALARLQAMSEQERKAFTQRALNVITYRSPTKEEARRMTREQLARLSPTEKYDLVRSMYDYPLTDEVKGSREISPYRSGWEGICHGWAPASINHAEPLPVEVRSRDGSITVPFGSGDVKALINYSYSNPKLGLFGGRGLRGRRRGDTGNNEMGYHCHEQLSKTNWGSGYCAGVNAGSFHLALTNYIALRKTAFIAEVSHGHEEWNNAVYSYASKIVETRQGPTRYSAPGTLRSVRLQTQIRFPSDDDRFGPQWDATVGREEVQVPDYGPISPELQAKLDAGYKFDVGNYDYWLDLGKNDEIIGGSWNSYDRPDLLWVMPKHEFKDIFTDLITLKVYRPAWSR